MHPGALLISILTASAAATPLVERAYAYETVVHTEVVTVTAGSNGGYDPKPHHHKHHKNPYHPAKPTGYSAPPKYKPQPHVPKPHKPKRPSNLCPEGTPSGYASTVVKHHNVHRFNHSAPAIQWDQGLANTAMKIAQTCVYAHNVAMDGGGYGQNIAAGISADDIGDAITDAFYNGEVAKYTYYGSEPDMGTFETWGHFSQIVWKDTAHVGCATFDCSGRGLANTGGDIPPSFTVCNYRGPGNFGGEYTPNVGSPLGHPTVLGKQSL